VILPSSLAVRLAGFLALGSLAGVVLPAAGWACVGGLVALALAVLVDGLRLPRRPVVTLRHLPRRLSLGESETILEELRNQAGFGLRVRLTQVEPPDVVLEPLVSPTVTLAARQSGQLRFTATAARRGERTLLRVRVRVGRPGGLAVRQYAAGEEAVLHVSPNVARVRRYEVLRQSRALTALGIHHTRVAGLGAEFDHLRSYSRGDDMRRIHWKATARRGHPISQVVRTERGQSVLIAVDVSHWMGISAGVLSRLDHAVDAALFLAHVARQSGDQVGLALFGHEVTTFLAPTAKPGQIHRILQALGPVQPRPVHPSYRNLARYVLSRRLRRSLIVVLTEPADPESARDLTAALAALRARHLPLAVGLQDPTLAALAGEDPQDVLGLCRRLAAGEVQEERAHRLQAQKEHGLQTLDVLPEDLSVSLVNRYLDLKVRGAL
jgi:uncharacterized protein (DUF58 family)